MTGGLGFCCVFGDIPAWGGITTSGDISVFGGRGVTGVEPVVARAELDRMTKAVGREMVRAAGQGWTRVRAEYRSVGRHVEADLLVTGPDGVARPVRPPAEVVDGLARLRAGMYRPGRGTWIGAVYEIAPPGTFECEFDPDVEPTWRRVPPPVGFVDELRSFPRSEEFIPDWFRARAGMPPAVSAETQSAGTPPHGIPLSQATPPGGQPATQPPQGRPPTGQPPQGRPVQQSPQATPPHGAPGPQGGRHAAPPPPWENPAPSGGPGRHAAGPGRPPVSGPRPFGPPGPVDDNGR